MGGTEGRYVVSGASSLDRTIAALADPRRRLMLDLLKSRPRSAGELAREIGLGPPALSRHLRVLRAAGLVTETHPPLDLRVRIYAREPAPMAELAGWLLR